MTSSRRKKNNGFWLGVALLLLAGTAAAVFVWPHAKSRWLRWRTEREVRKAADFLAKGDVRRAVLGASNALQITPFDAEATRLIATALEAAGAPEAEQWRARLDSLRPGDPANVLARARFALKSGNVETASAFLESLRTEEQNTAAYHAVAAAIARERRDLLYAESHWAEAVRLEPSESRHRLGLAGAQIESHIVERRETGLRTLRELQSDPDAGIDVLRLLLADAVRHRDERAALGTADALVAEPNCKFTDKLARLATLRLLNDPRSGPYLIELRDAALSRPVELFALLSWMNTHNLPLMVAEWLGGMPEDLTRKPPVCLAAAEAHMRNGDWTKLEQLATAASWEGSEHIRRAMLSLALEHVAGSDESEREWRNAVAAAGRRPDSLERLAKFANQAKWEARAVEIMWTLASLPSCPQWVLAALWQDAHRSGNTAQLQRLSGIFVKADPKSVATRNNYAFLSLLIRSEDGSPQRTAESLHRENPNNPVVASTYGLSLLQQGRAEEAVKVMSIFRTEELRQPQIALYHGMFLAAAGQPEKADEFLKLGASWPMLPEERSLLNRIRGSDGPAAQASGAPRR